MMLSCLSRTCLIVFLFTSLPVVADTSAKSVVASFYKSYQSSQNRDGAEDERGWLSWLLDEQRSHVEETLRSYLLRLETSNYQGPVLTVDPFSNGTWAMSSYTVKEPVLKEGLAYVPVFMYVGRGKGTEIERVRIVLRQSSGGWKIANVVYPALDGQPAWDLMSRLKQKLR